MKIKTTLDNMTWSQIIIYFILIILIVLGVDWLIWKLYQIIDTILLKYQVVDLPDFTFWEFFFLMIGLGIIINILKSIFKK